MTLTHLDKAPFPYFGGKRNAAATVWALLGDVHHYVEPFFGSGAVLLYRPHDVNRPYHSESVNDLDALLVNFWRSLQLHPDATAEAASYPVSEVDLMARHLALVRWKLNTLPELLRADPSYCDPVMAGWWVWGLSAWIGSGWCYGTGPWTEVEGRIVKQPPPKRGKAAAAAEREPGVGMRAPQIHDDGKGVNNPTAREPGVAGQAPHVHNNGQGVTRPNTREPGVASGIEVVHHFDPELPPEAYHPMTMPELRRWFVYLSARLRHVRIMQGPWQRSTTKAVVTTLSVGGKKGAFAGVFLDPPYDPDKHAGGMYAAGCGEKGDQSISAQVEAWCVENGANPKYRVVVSGYGDEHDALLALGWTKHEWYKPGFLTGGMGNVGGATNSQANQDRLWATPNCLPIGVAEPEG